MGKYVHSWCHAIIPSNSKVHDYKIILYNYSEVDNILNDLS